MINFNSLKKQRTYLTVFVGLIIAKRSMMATGTYIAMNEKTALLKILHAHNIFLRNCFNRIKCHSIPLNESGSIRDFFHIHDFINFAMKTAPVNYKMFQ